MTPKEFSKIKVGDRVKLASTAIFRDGHLPTEEEGSPKVVGINLTQSKIWVLGDYGREPYSYECLEFGLSTEDAGAKGFHFNMNEIDHIVASSADRTYSGQNSATVGEHCKICNQWSGLSKPNQPDGSFACYTCRETKGWML
jgi:hypothetical protein